MFFVVCCCFSNSTFFKNSFRNIIWVSNSLDPDQARHFVRPDLGPNCLQRLSADGTFLKLIYFNCPWTLAACVRISSCSCLHNKNTLFFKLPTLLTPSKAAYMVSGEGALSSVGREEEVICFSLTSWRMFARKVTKRKITFSSVILILRRSNNFSGAWKNNVAQY